MLALLLAALLVQQDPGAAPTAPAVPPDAPAESAPPKPPRAKPAPVARPAPRATPQPPPPPAPAPRAQGPLRGEWPAQPSGKRVTIEDTQPIDDALERIADAAGWNVVLNTGRTGNRLLVLKLRNVPVEDALRAALSGSGLVATRTGETVVVAEADDDLGPPPPVKVLSGFDRPSGKRFTGNFDETEVQDALRLIAKSSGLSMVFPPGDHGEISAHFENVPVEDALWAVLSQAGLTAEKQGEALVVREGRAFPSLPPGLSREARRAAEEAMRDAERAVRRAERDAGDHDDGDGGRDRQTTGEDLTLSPGESVRDVNVVKGNLLIQGGAGARDVSTVSGSVHLQSGASAREIVAVLGSVRLDGGSSAREVVAIGGDVDVGPGAEVERDVISVGGRVRVDPAADVGSTRSIPFPSLPGVVGFTTSRFLGGAASPLLLLVEALVKFAVLFVLGLLVLALFPRRVDAVAVSMLASPWKSVFAGLLGTVAIPVLLILLVVTIVGILLVPVQILAVLAAGVLGVTALTFHLGRSLPVPVRRRTQVIQLALGTAVFAALTSIPFLGTMAWMATWLLTFGAVLRSRFGQHGAAVLPTTQVPPPEAAP
jgi:hypothetical protein